MIPALHLQTLCSETLGEQAGLLTGKLTGTVIPECFNRGSNVLVPRFRGDDMSFAHVTYSRTFPFFFARHEI